MAIHICLICHDMRTIFGHFPAYWKTNSPFYSKSNCMNIGHNITTPPPLCVSMFSQVSLVTGYDKSCKIKWLCPFHFHARLRAETPNSLTALSICSYHLFSPPPPPHWLFQMIIPYYTISIRNSCYFEARELFVTTTPPPYYDILERLKNTPPPLSY